MYPSLKVDVRRWTSGPPRVSWADGVDVVRGSSFLDRFEEDMRVLGPTKRRFRYMTVDDRTKNAKSVGPAWWEQVADLARSHEMQSVWADVSLISDFVVSAYVNLGSAIDADAGRLSQGFTSMGASVNSPTLADGVSAAWFDEAVRFMVDAAVAIDAWSGAVYVEPMELGFPREHEVGMRHESRPQEEPDRLLGVSPVFLVGARALDAIGGLEWLERTAPVHEVVQVVYRDGSVGAVVRIGRDSDDCLERIGRAYEHFRPLLIGVE